MKTGMNLLLWTTHVTEQHFPLLEKLRLAGFDGVELPIFEGDEAHYQRIGRELDRLGLGRTAVTVVGPEASPISPEPSVRKAALERLRWAMAMARACGAELLCGPFHSPLGVFSGTGPTEDEKQRAVEVLRQAAEEAQRTGIRLAIEYLNRFECYFLTTAAEAKQLVERVNHPAFRMMYDTFHANIEEKNIAQTIASIRDILIHVHISENDRGTPGSGHVHWDDTFRTLRQIGYDGWLTIEAFGRALPALAAATKIWRDLFSSPEEVYTQGLAFVKSMWAKYAPAHA
ncbi:MAG: sugar phosphate isomerase/epimerase [Gemmatales bacterium]|nr:sugar phosphate isomerase/epimerase [Gemmatales bacterium]MDW8221534.1 sugar phosphate isomerase/epimerase family protein [Gemmatales bacterium]